MIKVSIPTTDQILENNNKKECGQERTKLSEPVPRIIEKESVDKRKIQTFFRTMLHRLPYTINFSLMYFVYQLFFLAFGP